MNPCMVMFWHIWHGHFEDQKKHLCVVQVQTFTLPLVRVYFPQGVGEKLRFQPICQKYATVKLDSISPKNRGENSKILWVATTYLAILCDLFGMVKWPFQWLSGLQLGDQKVGILGGPPRHGIHSWAQGYRSNSARRKARSHDPNGCLVHQRNRRM